MKKGAFRWWEYALGAAGVLAAGLVCVCAGSVRIPVGDALRLLWEALAGTGAQRGTAGAIILTVRLPRVVCVALTGASLALCGAAMQGLLRNPLADGSTLGVASGASLGAVAAIMLGLTFPGIPLAGTAVAAMIAAFLSLALILSLAWALDRSLSTGTIILIGVVYAMFVSALLSLLITFAGNRLRTITFWTMGSLAGADWASAALLAFALAACGGTLLGCGRELNALALGESQALHVGVPVRRVKLRVLIAVSALIGVCVSVGGAIGFVGLVTPHVVRLLAGPNHRRLLPACLFGGAIFLMLCDLIGRTILSPVELPIGVVTSLIGAVVFVIVLYRTGKTRDRAC